MSSFNQSARSSFWLSVENDYTILSQKATKTALPFATTYICEAVFSALTIMKTMQV